MRRRNDLPNAGQTTTPQLEHQTTSMIAGVSNVLAKRHPPCQCQPRFTSLQIQRVNPAGVLVGATGCLASRDSHIFIADCQAKYQSNCSEKRDSFFSLKKRMFCLAFGKRLVESAYPESPTAADRRIGVKVRRRAIPFPRISLSES